MQVLKTYLKVLPSYIQPIALYLGLFIMLIVIQVNVNSSPEEDVMQSYKFANISVEDLDNTNESAALKTFLSDYPDITVVELNGMSVQDGIYYDMIDYALTIEKGYGEKLKNGETENILTSFSIAESSKEIYLDTILSSYVSGIRSYCTGGFDMDRAMAKTAENMLDSPEIKIYDSGENGAAGVSKGYFFYHFIPYVSISLFLSLLVPIFSIFLDDNMRKRTLSAPISPTSYMAQMLLGAGLLSVFATVLMFVAGYFIVKDELFCEHFGTVLLQVILFNLFSLGLAGFVSVLFSGNKKLVNMGTSIVTNTVGLGMAFLCGVFVSQWLLSDVILTVARFLPAYWYTRSMDKIFGVNSLAYDQGDALLCTGMLALFAAAAFAAALLAANVKKAKPAR